MAEKFDPEAKLKIPTKMQAKDHVLNKVVAAQQSIDINTIHSVPEGNKQTNLLLNKRSEWKLTDHRIEDSSKLQSNQNTHEFSDSIPVTSKWISKSYDSHKFEKVLKYLNVFNLRSPCLYTPCKKLILCSFNSQQYESPKRDKVRNRLVFAS